MKYKVRVVLESELPIYRYKYVGPGLMAKTDDIVRTEKRTKILFSGSDAAFRIWEQGHSMPEGSRVEKVSVVNRNNSIERFNPTQCFSQCSIFHGNMR